MVASGRLKLLVALLPLLAACAPQPQSTPSASPESASTSTQAPPPTPTLAAQVSESQIVTRTDGEVEAIGLLTNNSPFAVGEVRLQVGFYDGDGQLIAQTENPLSLPWLVPGASSPYRARFPGPGVPSSVEVEAVAYQKRDAPSLALAVRMEPGKRSVEGDWRVVGTVYGKTDIPVRLEALLLGAYQGEHLVAISLPAIVPHRIPAGAFRPFEANFRQQLQAPTLRAFLAAEPDNGANGARLVANPSPALHVDEQGRPFVVGQLSNPSISPLSARLLLEVRAAESTVRVLLLESGIPLAPGEQRPFGLRIPEAIGGVEAGELEVRPYLDERTPAAGTRTRPLVVQVTGAEQIGGSYFLRGNLRNPEQRRLDEPTLFVALRSTEGALWSASWQTVAEELAGESEQAFVVSLPLPAGIGIETGEFDVRGIGLDRSEQ